jgi:hypothetical protein
VHRCSEEQREGNNEENDFKRKINYTHIIRVIKPSDLIFRKLAVGQRKATKP